jgi:hypothetical protein
MPARLCGETAEWRALLRWQPWRSRNILTASAMTPGAIIVSMIGVALPVLGGIWLTPKSAPWFLLRPGRSHLRSLRTASQLGQRIVPSSIGLSTMQMTIISETSRSEISFPSRPAETLRAGASTQGDGRHLSGCRSRTQGVLGGAMIWAITASDGCPFWNHLCFCSTMRSASSFLSACHAQDEQDAGIGSIAPAFASSAGACTGSAWVSSGTA